MGCRLWGCSGQRPQLAIAKHPQPTGWVETNPLVFSETNEHNRHKQAIYFVVGYQRLTMKNNYLIKHHSVETCYTLW